MDVVGAQLWEGGIGRFEVRAKYLEFAKTSLLTGTRDILRFSIEVEAIFSEGGRAGRRCMSPKITLGESYGKR